MISMHFKILTPNDTVIINPNDPNVKFKIDGRDLTFSISNVKKIPYSVQHLMDWLKKDGDMCFRVEQMKGGKTIKSGICIFEYANIYRNCKFDLSDIKFIGVFYRDEF